MGKTKYRIPTQGKQCSFSSSKCRVNYITTMYSLICFVSPLRSRGEGDEISFCSSLTFLLPVHYSPINSRVYYRGTTLQWCGSDMVKALIPHPATVTSSSSASLNTCRTRQHRNSLSPPLPTSSHWSNFNFFFNSTASIANGFWQLGN